MSKIINKVDKNILNKRKVNFLCKTEKDANELLKQLDKLGYKWGSGDSLNDIDYFDKYSSGIIYCVYDDKHVRYSSLRLQYDYIFKSKTKSNNVKSIKHIINGTTTIVILEDGRKGIAKLHPSDEFDEFVGFEIAYKRALGIYDKNIINKSKQLSKYTNDELIEELKIRLNK